ncbi:MAG: AAA family ATPase [Ignavibacteria bacterium]|nr:AAA family ATPase [Ignavibacteria bacterium]
MTAEELNNLQSEAYDHLWNGRFRLALTAAEKLFENRPNDSDSAICLAWAYLENGKPNKAMDYANLAVELKGDLAKTKFFRAYVLSRMSIFEGAIADIEGSIEKEKSLLSWTYLNKARAYAGLKQFDKADEAFENCFLLDDGKDANLIESKKLFKQAKKYFTKNISLNQQQISDLFQLTTKALKVKEYWFLLFASELIIENTKSTSEKSEAELLELEALFNLFQYRPALKKAHELKNKFKKNERFQFILNTLNKFILEEEEDQKKDLIIRKTQTELSYDLTELNETHSKKSRYNFNALFYPNDYSDIYSIRIFDAAKDSKIDKRIYFNQINKHFATIGAEVIFNNPFFSIEDKTLNCKAIWYINDYEVGTNKFRLHIPIDWDSVIFAQTIDTGYSGLWNVGQGKVEFYLNNFKVGEKYFGIDQFSLFEEDVPPKKPTKETKVQEKETDTKTTTQLKTKTIDERPLEELLKELDSYIGLTNIKQTVRDFISYLEFVNQRKKHGLKADDNISMNAVFLGNPGSGKTTIARLLGSIFKSMGILTSGHVIEVDRATLVGQYIGETAQKTEKIINESVGGLLFIDEAYTLIKKGGSSQDFGQEAIDILLKRMEDKKGEFVVIVAGYTEEMQSFLNSNPGLKSRFTHTFNFEDYTPEELLKILHLYLKKDEYLLTQDSEKILKKEFIRLYRNRDNTFGNARLVRNIFNQAKLSLSKRVVNIPEEKRTKDLLNTITEDDIKQILQKTIGKEFTLPINEESLSEALAELDSLVGLLSVKKEINDLVKLARYFSEQGEDLQEKFSNHYIFLGNPGTGKTTVARLFSKIFSSLGLLTKGHLVETDRQGLVAGYVGQTAEKTSSLIDKSLGGTLFIDEAYALVKPDSSGSDFGKEAIDILLKRMEDDRGKFIVIAAGYTDEMKKFISSNPGIQSRFSKSLTFEDYSPSELMTIVQNSIVKEKKSLSLEADELLQKHFTELYKNRDKKFGNARIVRNLLESIKQKMLLRIADIPIEQRTDENQNTILYEDIVNSITTANAANEYQVKGDPLKLQDLIDQLNSLIGLENVKEGIFKLISGSKIAQLKRERGLQVPDRNLNSLFIGNDGTGKTTVAKLLSKILKELGVLGKGHIVNVLRSDLVGAYPEQTILKTEELIDESIGGILFLDNADALFQKNDKTGLIILDTILKKIDTLKHKSVFIFSTSNNGMKTIRQSFQEIHTYFPHDFTFDNYKPRQLLAITYEIANELGYSLDEGALQVFMDKFNDIYNDKNESFSNARFAKELLYKAISRQEQRIAEIMNPTDVDLATITLEDVQEIRT